MQQLFLKKHEDRRLRAGHLWIFSNEVDVKRSPLTAFAPGEAAQVCAADGRTIGTAYVNPASLIAARIVSRKADEPLGAALIKKRLERALQLRETLFDVPFYRLCHGEGDWLPGLVLDRYGDVFSAQITTAGMEAQKDALLEVLGELFTPKAVLLRNDVGVRTMENLPLLVETGMGTVPDEIEVRESGAAFTVSLAEGQKTGWFYDQRPNRVEAAKYAKGKTVLDAFCYAGAFGVMAARNGAAGVTFLDASRQAAPLPPTPDAPARRCPATRWTRWRPCATGGGNSAWSASIPRPSSSARRTPNRASTPTAGSTIWACNSWKTGAFLRAVPVRTTLRPKRCAA